MGAIRVDSDKGIGLSDAKGGRMWGVVGWRGREAFDWVASRQVAEWNRTGNVRGRLGELWLSERAGEGGWSRGEQGRLANLWIACQELIEQIKCTRIQKLSKSLRDYYYKQGDRWSCGEYKENKCVGWSGGWEEVQGNREDCKQTKTSGTLQLNEIIQQSPIVTFKEYSMQI